MTPTVKSTLRRVLGRLEYDASYAAFDLVLHAECEDVDLVAECKRALAAADKSDSDAPRWEHIRSLVERAVGS